MFPPLYAFLTSSQDQIKAVFAVTMENTVITSMIYNPATSELEVELEMLGNVLNTTITIDFLPSVNVKPEYFATTPQNQT